MKKLKLIQFPNNKKTDLSKLSDYQIVIRNNSKKYIYKKTKICNTCGEKQSIKEYWVKDKHTGRVSNKCRDCELKAKGVVEVGRVRFAKIIFKKGFRRCSVCKEIKPLNLFSKNKYNYGGISNVCYKCSKNLLDDYIKKGKEILSDNHVKTYGKKKGITIFNDEIIKKLREEIQEKQHPKLIIDGQSFMRLRDFAIYIHKTYNNPITMTEKRIRTGKTLEECKLPERQVRAVSKSKGKIKISDTVTGKEYFFESANDKKIRIMLGKNLVIKGIKTGKPVKGSKWKNYLKVERITEIKQPVK